VSAALAADNEELVEFSKDVFGCEVWELRSLLEQALTQRKHEEIHFLAEQQQLPTETIERELASLAASVAAESLAPIRDQILRLLE
jgi:hypothetical protein